MASIILGQTFWVTPTTQTILGTRRDAGVRPTTPLGRVRLGLGPQWALADDQLEESVVLCCAEEKTKNMTLNGDVRMSIVKLGEICLAFFPPDKKSYSYALSVPRGESEERMPEKNQEAKKVWKEQEYKTEATRNDCWRAQHVPNTADSECNCRDDTSKYFRSKTSDASV